MTTSRRLHFVVGTSLLGASLAFGCTPKVTPDDDLHVNPGPNEPEPEPEVQPEPEPEADHVNVGPVDEPEPKEPQPDVNTGPIDEPAPTPKYVNTRPE